MSDLFKHGANGSEIVELLIAVVVFVIFWPIALVVMAYTMANVDDKENN